MAQLQALVAPLNGGRQAQPRPTDFEKFVNACYLPLYKRKWKDSTSITSENRIQRHLIPEFGERDLSDISREELQAFLDRKAADGFSRCLVDHLRWDLRSLFELAHHEGFVVRNPAKLLYTPREAKQSEPKVMDGTEVLKCISVLELRERLMVRLAIFAGMRPGEIFGLQWRHVQADHIRVEQRVYHGALDSPKSRRSVRRAALSPSILADLAEWRKLALDARPDGWLFPSENAAKPVRPENVWRRHIGAKLEKVGLDWVNFQVMRRTHVTLARKAGADPKAIADQLGHGLGVSLEVYARADLEALAENVRKMESSIIQ
jgi:integrase